MQHTIENENLICVIESNGAEIRSLKHKETGTEYIWQIDESIWGSSSPVLFPAIGKIKEGKIVYKDKDYAMTKHGIIRHNDHLSFEQLGNDACTFTLISSEETLKKYPYNFLFSVKYALVGQRLLMSYIVENKASEPIYFACGGHTAYACPLDDHTALSDYVIEFPESVNLVASTLGETGLRSSEKRKIASQGAVLPLSKTLFNEDALIFENIHFDWIRLRKKTESKGIVVRFTGYPHLALWSKPGADYVCIEPWLGLPDHEDESIEVTQKSTFQKLNAKSTFSIVIETTVE